SKLFFQPLWLAPIHFSLQLLELFIDLLQHRFRCWPVKPHPRGSSLELPGPKKGGQGEGDADQDPLFSPRSTFSGLDLLPSLALCFSIFIGGLAEDMRMALDELGGDCLSHVVEIEAAFFFGHARMKDDLEQKVAQFIAQRLAAGRKSVV